MSNMRKKSRNITPQLTKTWERDDKPWGAKNLQSRFIYANPAFYQLLNLPKDLDMIGLNHEQNQ
ncbi:hypothetical protein [Photorhabdus temperata]|uniref:PAS domain-containing protein n=1 Tax=Photorhabdus temperata J3 TaxID=1389415 RepID=U7QVA0_PHOTE|nr:hypothetical protein O185_25490 [Photorhabdus temperata J3]